MRDRADRRPSQPGRLVGRGARRARAAARALVSAIAGLPPTVFELLTSTAVTGVVATVDRDGRPHTAPFGSLWAASPDRLRFGCDRGHETFENIRRDGRVAVSVITPPDVAVTLFGRASILREAMETLPSDAVVEILVEDVKNDMLIGAAIDAGVSYSVPVQAHELIERYMLEIRQPTE
ncbi:MAG TPA: pyridoxamine 5'-phosphate oxidase family protein [Gaiellaceae bacterium]|nr:pyridoxamine 5'-phosphate oxidase family protein [Gaiellaceae bacterium]